jgi:hypothetical protein
VFNYIVLNITINDYNAEEIIMATNGKRTGIYIIAGVIVAVMIIAAIFASGVEFPSNSSNKSTLGSLRVSITDAPADLTNLNITVDGLYVNSVDSNSWIELNFTDNTPQVYFDLLALRNVTKDLSLAQIPAGNYSKIRLDVKTANATYTDGTTVDLTVPPGHIDVIIKFEVTENQETKLLIDMHPDTVAISNSHDLKPILKATVEQ